MGALDNLYVSSSFQGLLKMADSTNGLTNTLQTVQSGDGDNSPLQMSLTQVNISGSLFVNGVPILGSSSGTSGTSGSSGTAGSSGTSGTSGSSGSGFTYNGVWDNSTNYNVNDVVLYNGQTYVAIQANVNKQPSVQPAFWQVFSAAGSSGTSGTSGSSGTGGSDGSSGSSGTSGSSGADGLVGSNGTSGTSGSSGIDGTSGSSGTDGSSGTSGAVDYTGLITTGSVSSIGVTGSTQSISGGFLDNASGSYIPALNVDGLNVYGITRILPTLDVSGSLQAPNLDLGDTTTGSQFPIISLNVDSSNGNYSTYAGVQATDKVNGNTVGFAQSCFNTTDGRIAGVYYGFGTGNNEPYGPGSGDACIMMTYSGDTNLHITRNSIITGSLQVKGNTIISGSLIGGVVNNGIIKIQTEANRSGSIQFQNYITSSAPISQSNFIFGGPNVPSVNTTGSVIISGSNNIIFNGSRTSTLGQGTLGYIQGNNNIIGTIPTISTSSFLNSNIFISNANTHNSTFTIDAPATGAIVDPNYFNQISNNYLGSVVLLRHKSGSFNFANNSLQGTINSFATQSLLYPSGTVSGPTIQSNVHAGSTTTLSHISSSIVYVNNISNSGNLLIRNSATHPAATNGSGSVTVASNIFGGGGHTLTISGSGTQLSKGISQNIVVGSSNELNIIVSGSNAFVTNTGIIGLNLIVSGSNGGVGAGGSTFVGRFNATGSLQESTNETVFVVGTGTGASGRRNALRIDSNNNSQFTGSVQISGSLSVNGVAVSNDRNGLITTGSIGGTQSIIGTLNTFNLNSTRQNLGEYLSFTGSRFTPNVLTSVDLENTNQTQFVFNQLHLGDSLTGTQLKLNTNKASNFTEVALNTRYSGQSDASVTLQNNNTGASTLTINAKTTNIQNGSLNVQLGITGSLNGNADTATTASFALNANANRNGLITTGSISNVQTIAGGLNISGSDTQYLKVGAGDSTLKIGVLNSSNPFLYTNTNNYSTVIGNCEGSNNGFTTGSEKNMIFTGFYLAFNSGSQNTVISGGGGNFRSGSSNTIIGGPGSLQFGNNNTYIGVGTNNTIESDTIRIGRTGLGLPLFLKSGNDALQINGDTQITGSLLITGNITGSLNINANTQIVGNTQMSGNSGFPLTIDGTIQSKRFSFAGNPFNSNIGGTYGSLNYDADNKTLQYSNGDFGTPDTSSFNNLTTNTGSNVTQVQAGARYAGTTAQTNIINNNGARSFVVDVDSTTISGSLTVTGGINYASGSNTTVGTAVLDGANPATVTVSNSLVTSNSLIFLTKQTNNHPNAGPVVVSSKGSGTFTITSNHNGDTDVVAYQIINPA